MAKLPEGETAETVGDEPQEFEQIATEGLTEEELPIEEEEFEQPQVSGEQEEFEQVQVPQQQAQERLRYPPQYPPQYYQQAQLQRPQLFNIPGESQIPPGYRLQEDLMTGRKRLVRLPPKEAWVR